MPTFRFTALKASGRKDEGMIDADNARAARALLRARGLIPIALNTVEGDGSGAAKARSAQSVPSGELTLLTRQLASLLIAKLPLAAALTVLVEQTEKASTRALLATVRADVVSGYRFADALANFPRAFPQVYRAMVAAGEDAGDLGLVLERLARYLEERQAMRSKILTALLYPAIVSSVALIIVLFLMTYVVPQVVEVFQHTRQALPWPTQALLWLSHFIRVAGPFLLLGILIGGFALRRALRGARFRFQWDQAALKLPILGTLIRGADTARFASTLAILTQSGVPMLHALRAARATVNNVVLGQAVEAALARVREGAHLAGALEEQKVFPAVMIHLVRNGEVTGDLAAMLGHSAVQLRAEVERRATTLTTLLEPLLVLAMGLLVLAIVLAVLMPIVEINQLVR